MIPSLHHRVWEKEIREKSIVSAGGNVRERPRAIDQENQRATGVNLVVRDPRGSFRSETGNSQRAESVTARSGESQEAERPRGCRDSHRRRLESWYGARRSRDGHQRNLVSRYSSRWPRWCLVVWERYRRGLAAPESKREQRNPNFLGFSKKNR